MNFSSTVISPELRQGIVGLAGICEVFDGASACLQMDHSLNYRNEMRSWFLATDEESGRSSDDRSLESPAGGRYGIAGVASVFAPMADEAELSACVFPEARHMGIFTSLERGVVDELRRHGVSRLLYVVDRKSASGQAMLAHRSFPHHHTEYVMEYGMGAPRPRNLPADLHIRRAGGADMAAMVAVSVAAFGDSEAAAEHLLEENLESSGREQYVAVHRGEIVGICSMADEDDIRFLNGLGIHPGCQGKGFGASFVSGLVALSKGRKPVRLEVDSANVKAHRLYKKLGFVEISSTDYYLRLLE